MLGILPHVRMNIRMSRIRPTASVSVDPLKPMLGSMASLKILKIISSRDVLGLSGTKEVPCDGVCVVAK